MAPSKQAAAPRGTVSVEAVRDVARENLLHETDPECLDWMEAMASTTGYMNSMAGMFYRSYGGGEAPSGPSSSSHVREAHARMFGAVYGWAGQYRDGQGVEEAMDDLMARTGIELSGCRGRKAAVAAVLGDFCKGFDEIRPFEDGNGRTEMLMCMRLAKSAGYDLFIVPDDLGRFNKARNRMPGRGAADMAGFLDARMFDQLDPSPVHMALQSGLVSELQNLPWEGELKDMGRDIRANMERRGPVYGRSGGRPLPSYAARCTGGDKDEYDGPSL